MIPVRETDQGFEVLSGNPVLLSLDGKEKAPLAVLLHDSWSDQDRARFGVYLAEEFVVPEGKQRDGAPAYERRGGKVVEFVPVRDAEIAPEPTPAEKIERVLGVSLDELKQAL